MAVIEGRPTVTLNITLRLTEAEAGALDAMVGYGVEPFLKVFYEKLGRAYLEPYEAGLRSLFESVRSGAGSINHYLTKAKNARETFSDGSDHNQQRVAAMKGCSARAAGYPVETDHGYAGVNKTAWENGWRYCDSCLSDPNYIYKPTAPSKELVNERVDSK